MKNNAINNWIELKKQAQTFETIIQCKRTLKKATPWDDMALFFREADKHIK